MCVNASHKSVSISVNVNVCEHKCNCVSVEVGMCVWVASECRGECICV